MGTCCTKNPLQEGHKVRIGERSFQFHVLLGFYIISMFCFLQLVNLIWHYYSRNNPVISLPSFAYHQAFLKKKKKNTHQKKPPEFAFVAVLPFSIYYVATRCTSSETRPARSFCAHQHHYRTALGGKHSQINCFRNPARKKRTWLTSASLPNSFLSACLTLAVSRLGNRSVFWPAAASVGARRWLSESLQEKGCSTWAVRIRSLWGTDLNLKSCKGLVKRHWLR